MTKLRKLSEKSDFKAYRTAITFGTFDLLHVGHIRILERAASYAEQLVVGVSSDKFSHLKKGKMPVYSESNRLEIVAAIGCVSAVFLEESFEQKRDYIRKWNADCLIMGDDWEGHFDDMTADCSTVYLPRTENISSTEIEEYVQGRAENTKSGPSLD